MENKKLSIRISISRTTETRLRQHAPSWANRSTPIGILVDRLVHDTYPELAEDGTNEPELLPEVNQKPLPEPQMRFYDTRLVDKAMNDPSSLTAQDEVDLYMGWPHTEYDYPDAQCRFGYDLTTVNDELLRMPRTSPQVPKPGTHFERKLNEKAEAARLAERMSQ